MNTEFKGTQGDWKLSNRKTFGRQMVDLGDFNGCIDVWYHNGESMTKEEAQANAQLMAAAPELLKALIAVTNELHNAIECLNGLESAKINTNIKQADKAINKALGNMKNLKPMREF